MKLGAKIFLAIITLIILFWAGLRIAGLSFYRGATPSMEMTVHTGALVMVWNESFTPDRFEIITYHNPEGDTVLVPYSPLSYYAKKRSSKTGEISSKYQKEFVPLSEREVWLGRCVGLPGDRVNFSDGDLYINDVLYENEYIKRKYFLKTNKNKPIANAVLEKNNIKPESVFKHSDSFLLFATKSQYAAIHKISVIDTSYCLIEEQDHYDDYVFPYSTNEGWNRDNFGDLEIPKKGNSIKLTLENLTLYSRLIEAFEGNSIVVRDSSILVNGNAVDSYTPKQDYFFVCNDNRGNSYDSRFYGFLPQDHISGRVLKVFN